MIEVRKHKGRSGKSVYEWRVYRVWHSPGGREHRTQLTKRRTQDAAERDARFYRDRDSALCVTTAAT